MSDGHGTVLAWAPIVAHDLDMPPAATLDAASGDFGLAMGATPTAVAIMTAITKAHGASPRSLLVVPLVGAFFVDIANDFALQGFVRWLGRRS